MKWLSIRDIEFGIKRKLYELQHHADGKTLVYNAKTKQYVGHLDNQTNYFKQDENYIPQSNEYYNLFGDIENQNNGYSLF